MAQLTFYNNNVNVYNGQIVSGLPVKTGSNYNLHGSVVVKM